MTTFISCQPWKSAPFSRIPTFRKSPKINPPGGVLRSQSPQRPAYVRPVSDTDFVEVVDLTTSDHQHAAREHLVAREILEPVDHGSGQYGVRVSRNSCYNRVNKTDSSKVGNTEENDIDYDSDTSGLPSLQDLVRQTDKDFEGSGVLSPKSFTPEITFDGAREEGCCKSDRENPAVSATEGVRPGSSQGEENNLCATDHA